MPIRGASFASLRKSTKQIVANIRQDTARRAYPIRRHSLSSRARVARHSISYGFTSSASASPRCIDCSFTALASTRPALDSKAATSGASGGSVLSFLGKLGDLERCGHWLVRVSSVIACSCASASRLLVCVQFCPPCALLIDLLF